MTVMEDMESFNQGRTCSRSAEKDAEDNWQYDLIKQVHGEQRIPD